MKISTALLACLLALPLTGKAQSVEEMARATGNSVKATQFALDAGMVFDPSTHSMTSPGSVGKPIPKPHFIYYNASQVVQVIDANGELHLVPVFLHRYNPVTKEDWAQTLNGRWLQLQ